ncbi:hypothetical protein ACIBI8_13700 [Streptomyces sp. NPDC050529]|uniref:hypothetical protein n=1 Tax=unclassified Streptomyces TaxID=2593676 RepID=UPI002DDC3CC6|nr:hypothetical protein [Streptomyces sp. NBC_01022]WRZ83114.1 hypothetical protein OG316_24030 [Streptomyces sp. NBC_01022]
MGELDVDLRLKPCRWCDRPIKQRRRWRPKRYCNRWHQVKFGVTSVVAQVLDSF